MCREFALFLEKTPKIGFSPEITLSD